MTNIAIDQNYLLEKLGALLAIPSPTGFTDEAVHYVARELERLGLEVMLTRRGAIRARRNGNSENQRVVSFLISIRLAHRSNISNRTGGLSLFPLATGQHALPKVRAFRYFRPKAPIAVRSCRSKPPDIHLTTKWTHFPSAGPISSYASMLWLATGRPD